MANTVWIGSTDDKLYLTSGEFTSTLKDSEAIGTIDATPTGISNDGTNTPWTGATDDKQLTTLANSGARAKRSAMRDLVHTKAGKAQVKAYRATLTGKERADFNKNYMAARGLFK